MADIYIDAVNITNKPTTDKAFRELAETYTQVTGTVHDFNDGFDVGGMPYNAGVVVQTTNSPPDPDEAAIIALIEDHDGSEDVPTAPSGMHPPTTFSKAIQQNNTTTYATKATVPLLAVDGTWVITVSGVLRQSDSEESSQVDIFETDSGTSLLNQTIQVSRGENGPEPRASFSNEVSVDTLETDSPVKGVGVRFRTSSGGKSYLSDVAFTPVLQEA